MGLDTLSSGIEVLIVEDDVVDRKSMERLLKASTISVRSLLHADSLASCMLILARHRPDVVLMDLNLPDSNGVETVTAVHRAHPWATVVVVTGSSDDGLGLRSVSAGAQDYLVKGQIDLATLERVICYAMERKRQQELIRQERDFAEGLIQTAQVIVLVLDTSGRIMRFNPFMESVCGYRLEEVKGMDWFEVFVPARQRQQSRGLLLQRLQGNPADDNVWPILTKDGSERLIEWAVTILTDQEGRPSSLLCTGQDVTDRMAAQEAIRRANLKLQQANSELRSMQAQIVQSEKLASVGQLAAGMAHEMNTPLGFVASNFETLRGYMNKLLELLGLYEQLTVAVEEGLREKRLKLADAIRTKRRELRIDFLLEDISDLFAESKEGLEQVGQIVQSLRDFARIDQAEELDEYDINDGIRHTLAVASKHIEGIAQVRLELGQVEQVFCRAGQINQALHSIILNAAQAIASQGRADLGTITIRTFMDQGQLVCKISDDGPGIKPEHLSKVFDPFFTTKPVGEGKGLGLATAYDVIVNKHKGRMDVESTEGNGATFTIYLPIKQQERLQTITTPAGGTHV